VKLEFSWTSRHPAVHLRLLRAGGEDVQTLDENGAEIDPPTIVRNRQTLRISPRFVTYGTEQRWFVRILVVDSTNANLAKLTIKAIYEDGEAPGATEDLVREVDVKSNEASDHEMKLAIPARTR
jgi:hypothetical protein